MSMIMCKWHDRWWDSDMMDYCPVCDCDEEEYALKLEEAEAEQLQAEAYSEWCANKNKEQREEQKVLDPREIEYWETLM